MARAVVTLVAGIAALAAAGAARAEEVVYLASLDWPPYTMATERRGAVEEVARQAFKAMGRTLVVDYLPWKRALINARADSRYAGYLPEYRGRSTEAGCVLSDPIGSGPLGFGERKDAPVAWDRLDDLAGIRIGTVAGYVNSDDFDARARDGRLSVEEAQSDVLNLRKVLAGRVRLAVIDRNVMDYLLKTDPFLESRGAQLQFNGHLLEDKDLFVCFNNDDRGRSMAKVFNQGLAGIDARAILDGILREQRAVR